MAATRTTASFTVGWVCALPIELAAAQNLMDEEYEDLPQPPADTNIYTYGRVGEHNVVAACLPAGQIGNNSAAVVAARMQTSFPSLRFGVLVGIGGGIPNDEHDIRLGDVVISQPTGQYGGVVQFDFGKTGSGGDLTRTGSLDAPPTILRNALAKLCANVLRGRVRINKHLSAFSELSNFARPGPEEDVLYATLSQHIPGLTCAQCKKDDIIPRQPRTTSDPILHFGTIASGNQVMKDAPTRDRINQSLGGGVLCFEMEAAGLMNNFPCLVIRGICDYADAHMNKRWQPYAAATAAAYAKELLRIVPQVMTPAREIQREEMTSPVRSLVLQNSVPMLSNEQKDCLRSLYFPEQESRYLHVHSAKDTCHWLLEDSQYQAWINEPRGLFWIKGNPGAGKSALMKYAVTMMKYEQPDDLVVSFFIHGRGTMLQKSPLGVFRALLNTMLAAFPKYLSQLTKRFEDRERRCGSYQEMRWNWTKEELQDFMSEILTKGTKDLPVIMFIDALDECGEHDARALLDYFRVLMKQTEHEEGNLKICFSSRHYPILGPRVIPTVYVEDRNHADIRSIVRERLKEIQPGDWRSKIEQEILSKARGGFQWAVLVTARIVDGNAIGIKKANLLETLTRTPETLDELYQDIFSSSAGTEKANMVKIFQWILLAKRPLASQELREALATDSDMAYNTISDVRNHDSWVGNLSQFEKYVTYISRGLVEFQTRELWEDYEPGGESWDREAQFIHQSVANYILEKFLHGDDSHQNGDWGLLGAGHFQISRSCLKYITLSEVLEGASLPRGPLCARFPLVSYAVQFLFHHIHEAEKAGFSRLDFLSLTQWDRQSKVLQQIDYLWSVLDPDYVHAPKHQPFIQTISMLLRSENTDTASQNSEEEDDYDGTDNSDLESILSVPSETSSQSSASYHEEIFLAASELGNLLLEVEELHTLLTQAYSKVGKQRFARNIGKLLTIWGRNLRSEASEESQYQIVRFVQRYAQRTAVRLGLQLAIASGSHLNLGLSQPDESRLNDWIKHSRTSQDTKVGNITDPEVIEQGFDQEFEERSDDGYDDDDANIDLEAARAFLRNSAALLELCNDLRQWLDGKLPKKINDSLDMFLDTEAKVDAQGAKRHMAPSFAANKSFKTLSVKDAIRHSFLSVVDRAYQLAINSDLSIAQVTAFFVAPILFSLFIVGLAVIPAFSSELLNLIESIGFVVSIRCVFSIFNLLKHTSFNRHIKRVRILLTLEAECPFPACQTRAGLRTYKYPQQWLNHLATEHSGTASRSVVDATSGRAPRTQTSRVGQPAHETTQGRSTHLNLSMHGEEQPELAPRLESSVLLALDLCLPEPATKATHQWRELDFKPTWMDQKLFQDLAERYFMQRLGSQLLLHRKLYVQLWTWLAFTRLSRVSPTRFFIIQDYMGNGNKAICHKHVPSETTIPPILTHYSTQQYLADCIHVAWKNRDISLRRLNTNNESGSYFIGLIRLLARNKHPLPTLGYEGNGLEFVESLNLRKLSLQLLLALTISIISGTVSGVLSGSLERGFVVGGLGISLSQLFVAVLVFVVPPPRHT